MNCEFCGHFHYEICPSNPAYPDGDGDVKVPAGSRLGEEED